MSVLTRLNNRRNSSARSADCIKAPLFHFANLLFILDVNAFCKL